MHTDVSLKSADAQILSVNQLGLAADSHTECSRTIRDHRRKGFQCRHLDWVELRTHLFSEASSRSSNQTWCSRWQNFLNSNYPVQFPTLKMFTMMPNSDNWELAQTRRSSWFPPLHFLKCVCQRNKLPHGWRIRTSHTDPTFSLSGLRLWCSCTCGTRAFLFDLELCVSFGGPLHTFFLWAICWWWSDVVVWDTARAANTESAISSFHLLTNTTLWHKGILRFNNTAS